MRLAKIVPMNASPHSRNSCQGCSIQAFCLSRDLKNKELDEFNSIIRRRKPLQRGEHLFREGDVFNSLYIVHSGSVKSYISSPEGEQQITGFHFTGELLGIDGFDTKTHNYSVEALETSSICELSFSNFEALCTSSPAIRQQFLKAVSREIISKYKMALMLGKMCAEQRVACFIINMSMRHKWRGNAENLFRLSMTRYDIANYLGLAVETVSRLLTRFQEQGVLRVSRRDVMIQSMSALKKIADNCVVTRADVLEKIA